MHILQYSCGSFEFLSRNRGRSSSTRRDLEDEISDEDDRLFFPQRNEEKEAILRQIQTLNDNLGIKVHLCSIYTLQNKNSDF